MSKTMVLAVIGGGSSQWMISLMKDVFLLDAVDGGEIRLVDPDRGGAEAVASMLARFNEARGKDYRVSVCDDRAEALGGADFVMATFSPGSMDAFEYDLEIPIRYGIRQPVSMTVGPAGISAALRTVPVAAEVVEDMERYCAGAWLLKRPPIPMKRRHAGHEPGRRQRARGGALPRVPRLPCAGRPPSWTCTRRQQLNVVEQLYRWLPETGGCATRWAGINHFIWILAAELNGRDVLPDIRRFAREHRDLAPAGAAYSLSKPARRQAGAVPDLRLPAAGRRPAPGRVLAAPVQRPQRLRHELRGGEDHRRLSPPPPRAQPRARAAHRRRHRGDGTGTRSGEEMTEVINAILTGGSTTAILNLPKPKGQIGNLPTRRHRRDPGDGERRGDPPGAVREASWRRRLALPAARRRTGDDRAGRPARRTANCWWRRCRWIRCAPAPTSRRSASWPTNCWPPIAAGCLASSTHSRGAPSDSHRSVATAKV